MTDFLALTSILTLGLLLGLRHAFEADHIAAVSAIVSRTKSIRKSAAVGIFWGIGHTLPILALGLIILLLEIKIPQGFSHGFELLVGFILVYLGLDVMLKEKPSNKAHTHKNKSFLMGIAHGLAGGAAVILLILPSIDSILLGITYIFIFGAGTIGGMLVFGTLVSLPFVYTSNHSKLNKKIKILAGLFSIIVGIIVIAKTITAFL